MGPTTQPARFELQKTEHVGRNSAISMCRLHPSWVKQVMDALFLNSNTNTILKRASLLSISINAIHVISSSQANLMKEVKGSCNSNPIV